MPAARGSESLPRACHPSTGAAPSALPEIQGRLRVSRTFLKHIIMAADYVSVIDSPLCHATRLIAASQVLGKVTEDHLPPYTYGASDGKSLQQGACQPGQSNKTLDSSKMRPPIALSRQPQRGGLERCVACYIALAVAPVV